MASLYLHIPFCRAKCGYCDFTSFPGKESLFAPYVESLCRELQIIARGNSPGPLSSLFVGGGTPTALPIDLLVKLLDCCCNLYGLASTAEVTVEANPGTIDTVYLQRLKASGVNRLSIGCQSFVADELVQLGRIHGPKQAEKAVIAAKEVGFNGVSLDVMYGIPGQTLESLEYSLERAISLEPDHLSMYQLGIEPETPFGHLDATGDLLLPDEVTVASMDTMIQSRCADAGFDQYEISNFARKGYQCRHNLNYWHNRPYWAAGAGAVSYLDGTRTRRAAQPDTYITSLQQDIVPIEEQETLSLEDAFRETVVMGLRMLSGVNRTELLQRFDIDILSYYGTLLEGLERRGLLLCRGEHVLLTRKGLCFANQVMAELV